ncbi:MAG: hypothetical protein E6J37_13160 [Chloroflexi bacterium]|nr:MAG: hypothetical protein E6J37_13160 [Chloroflexota bacterium]
MASLRLPLLAEQDSAAQVVAQAEVDLRAFGLLLAEQDPAAQVVALAPLRGDPDELVGRRFRLGQPSLRELLGTKFLQRTCSFAVETVSLLRLGQGLGGPPERGQGPSAHAVGPLP